MLIYTIVVLQTMEDNDLTENEQKNENYKIQQEKPNLLKTILGLTLILVIVVALFYLTSSNGRVEISAEEYYADLQAGIVKEVHFSENYIAVYYKDGAEVSVKYLGPDLKEDIIEMTNKYNLANENSVKKTSEIVSSFSWYYILYPVILIGGAFLVISLFAKQINSANKQSFDFTKNRAKIALSLVRFSDVAGADEEKEEVKEIVEFLKNPQKFTNMGARIPKGVLLVGPPGTGKTLLAKAIAGEASVPFFTISGSDFMELFVGVGASRVRDLFDKAKKASPCIIFIDEIDAIGRQRGTGLGGGNDEREQTLNQLLVQMDGFETNEGIIIIAATNRADILDPALMRPGRFDRQIYIHVPDVKGREEILKVHARNKKFAKNIDFKQIARITSGFTGAELENLLNEAAILAARDNKTEITMKDITEGIDKVTMGPQKKSMVVTERDKKITAYHESGHAIVSRLVQNSDPVHEVSIIPRGNAAGYTVSRPETDDTHITKSKLFDMITMMLSGRKAEEIFIGDYTTGASNDLERATSIARKMVVNFGMGEETGLMHLGSENSYFFGKDYVERNTYSEHYANLIDNDVKRIMNKCAEESEKIINANKKKITTMVEVLLAKETIYSDEVDMIMNGASAKEVIDKIEADAEASMKEAEKERLIEEKRKEDEAEGKLKSSIVKRVRTKKPDTTDQTKSDKEEIKEEQDERLDADKTKIEVLDAKDISYRIGDALKEDKTKGKSKK